MDEFPYYGISWFFYLLAAACFLLLSAWKSQGLSDWIRIPILCFVAAMALTPGITVSGESWWSPAAIIMIFELDQNGLPGMVKSLISIITVWIVLMGGTVIIRKLIKKKRKQKPEASEQISETDDYGQPELQEPD